MLEFAQSSHRRYNPLLQEWVLVSPHRLQRPWQGERGPDTSPAARPAYDPQCYLCPGNVRAGGERNPHYEQTYVFDNDYASLQPSPAGNAFDDGLLAAEPEAGRCRVVCFSPRHDLDIATMAPQAIRGVIDAWSQEYRDLLAQPGLEAVTIFENRGAMMGASNPHPHSQIWANAHVPNELLRERSGFDAYAARSGGACLLCTYVERELQAAERVVFSDENVCVVVPFWAVWPFETLLLTRTHRASLDACTSSERDSIALAMQTLVRRYDALFGVPFPYSMGWHQERHLHAHYFPPLLRSATVRKYFVGYEMLAQPQRDLTAEGAAERLRAT